MTENQGTPKIQIDSDWKAEAQREKERLAQKEQARAASAAAEGKSRGVSAGHPQELPEPDFRALVGMLASQAIMGLGAMADPQSNRVMIDLEGSRFAIDLLDLLEQKTKGNLTDDEAKELRQVLAELRNRYVQITQLVARQMAQQQPPQSPGAPAGKLVQP